MDPEVIPVRWRLETDDAAVNIELYAGSFLVSDENIVLDSRQADTYEEAVTIAHTMVATATRMAGLHKELTKIRKEWTQSPFATKVASGVPGAVQT